MLYLVGGASRAGKTMVAKRILQDAGIPYLSLDWLMMGFTNGLPQYGIHDKLMPAEIAGKLWVFLRPMLESMIWSGADHVIEGEALLPRLIREFMNENPDEVAVCFLGYAEVNIERKLAEIRQFSLGDRDWLTKEEDATIRRHIENMVAHSVFIQSECEKHKLRYFDASTDLLDAVQECTDYLLRQNDQGRVNG